MIVTNDFLNAIKKWMKETKQKKIGLARLSECDPSTVTRIFQRKGKQIDDRIAERICTLIGYNKPPVETMYKKVLDNCDCPIVCFMEAKALYVNKAFERLMGKPAKELVGHDLTTLLAIEYRTATIKRIMNRDETPYEMRLAPEQGGKKIRVVPKMLTNHYRMVTVHVLEDNEAA